MSSYNTENTRTNDSTGTGTCKICLYTRNMHYFYLVALNALLGICSFCILLYFCVLKNDVLSVCNFDVFITVKVNLPEARVS